VRLVDKGEETWEEGEPQWEEEVWLALCYKKEGEGEKEGKGGEGEGRELETKEEPQRCCQA